MASFGQEAHELHIAYRGGQMHPGRPRQSVKETKAFQLLSGSRVERQHERHMSRALDQFLDQKLKGLPFVDIGWPVQGNDAIALAR